MEINNKFYKAGDLVGLVKEDEFNECWLTLHRGVIKSVDNQNEQAIVVWSDGGESRWPLANLIIVAYGENNV